MLRETAAPCECHRQTPHGEVYLWLVTQAHDIREKGHPWSAYIAAQIETLARDQAFTAACTPEDMVDRLDCLERELMYESMMDGPDVEF